VGGILEVLVVFEKGDACVFQVRSNYQEVESNGEESVLCSTDFRCESGVIAGFLGLVGGSGGGPVGVGATFAIGQRAEPAFVHVATHDKASGSCLSEVTIPDHHSAAAVSTSSKKGPDKTVVDAIVMGPHETLGKKRPVVALENGIPQTHEVPSSSSSKKAKDSPTTDPALSSEPTMQQRLDHLSQLLSKVEKQQPAASSSSALAAPLFTSDSLSTLIGQALQAGDDPLLEQCLSCGDRSTVEATARRLPTQRVLPFLRKLVAKFEKRPTRGALLTQWLAAVLRLHTAYLITLPDLSYQLAGLSQLLESRLACYSRLSSLAGRLDLLLSQVSYQQQQGRQLEDSENGEEKGFKASKVYKEDTESSEQDEEVDILDKSADSELDRQDDNDDEDNDNEEYDDDEEDEM